jgi:hypothetical protein
MIDFVGAFGLRIRQSVGKDLLFGRRRYVSPRASGGATDFLDCSDLRLDGDFAGVFSQESGFDNYFESTFTT